MNPSGFQKLTGFCRQKQNKSIPAFSGGRTAILPQSICPCLKTLFPLVACAGGHEARRFGVTQKPSIKWQKGENLTQKWNAVKKCTIFSLNSLPFVL